MCGNIVCIAAVVLGIDAGWRPMPEGGLEYLIQIEPELIETLRSGEAIQSEIPPFLNDVRAYRITVGTGTLPREAPPAVEVQSSKSPLSASADPATGPPSAPRTLPPEVTGKPIDAQRTAHVEWAGTPPRPGSKSAADQRSWQQRASKPWMTLTLALFGLFASLGGNAYLFWIVRDGRRRYRELTRRVGIPIVNGRPRRVESS